jgi:uncharacterized repeat protein (TIGR02543 family)
MNNKKPGVSIVGCIIAIIVAIVAIVLFIYKPWEGAPSVNAYVLTTNVNPSAAGSISPSGGQYAPGAQVTLTASPASGYTFDHWSGGASGTTPTITVSMYSDKSLTANFKIASESTHEIGKREQYFVDRTITGYDSTYEPIYKYTYMELTTVACWEKQTQGSPTVWTNPLSGFQCSDWLIEFETHQAQWVINWYYKPRASTPLDSPDYNPTVNVVIWPKATFDSDFWTEERGLSEFSIGMEADNRGVSDKGVYCTVFHQAGDYVIVITPSATEDILDWWVSIGAE